MDNKMTHDEINDLSEDVTIAEMAERGDPAACHMVKFLASDLPFKKTLKKYAEKFDRKDTDVMKAYETFADGRGLH